MKMQLFQWQSLKSRLTLLTLSIFLICVWGLTFYTSRILRDDMQHLLGAQQFSTATFLAREIDGEFNSRINAMEQYAKGRIVPSMLTNAAALQERLESSPAILSMFNAGIFVTGENGVALASVPESIGRVGINYMERDSISAAILEGRSSVSEPVIGKRLHTPIITIVVPIRDAAGKIIGALAGVTDLSQPNFFDTISEGHYGNSGDYLLISPKQNIIVTASDKTLIMQPAPAPGVNAMYDQYLQGFEGSGVGISSQGVNELSASKRIPITGWFAIVTLPTDEAFAPIRALTQHIFKSAFVLSLLAVVTIWWLISRVLHQRFAPMISASKLASTHVAKAEPIPLIQSSRQDEIGELVSSFNELLVTLKQRDDYLSRERGMMRTLIYTLPDLIWLKNEEGVYLACNKRFEQFYGTKEADIIGKTDYDFVSKELADFFRRNDRLVMEKNGPSVNEEEVLFAADGHREFLETTKVPMHDAQGNLLGVLGIGHDITERKKIQDDLAANEARLRAILSSTRDCVKLVSHDGTLISMNRAGLELIEADTPEDAVNQCIYEVLAPEYRQAFTEFNERICDGRLAGGSLQFEIIGLKGTRRWMETRAVPFLPPEGGETLQLAFTEEITERKQSESKLKLAASVFTHAREGILITDRHATIVDVNQTFSDITGYSREEVIGQNPRMLQSGKQSKDFYVSMWDSLIEKGHWYGELWNRRKDGAVFAELVTISAVYDANGQVNNYVGLFTDITPMKDHQAQLEHIAHFDALTALPNRMLLSDRLHQALIQSQRRKRSLAVTYLDLDGFKEVNDHYGHQVGDELLIGLSARMKDALREGDTLARMGGDEFVAVLVDLEQPIDYEPVLSRLLHAASAPIRVGDVILNVSASIGVTLSPRDGIEPDQLIRQADQAMYQAKQSGKNRYHLFDIDFDQQVKSQISQLDKIRQALLRNEFVLYYQPKVVMSTGEVIGAEALIRWQHPEQGLLSPAVFLPLIHDHPLSIELGEWVINEALNQMGAWHATGLDIPVSVNIGARQLQHGHFVARLSEILATHPGVLPSYLELEILETSALEDLNLSTEVMRACRNLGVRFALDDFGTGYSSLTYLRYLPANVIKIDQTFVRDMLNDQDDQHIVEAVVELARTFGRDVIAEGVETVEHGNALIRLGCLYAQGYAIARPMPGCELPGWAATWKPAASWLQTK